MAPSEIMRRIKGRSSSKLFESFPDLKKRYWGGNFWSIPKSPQDAGFRASYSVSVQGKERNGMTSPFQVL
jgi:hypothetical protein